MMIEISGYKIEERIYESSRTEVYRGLRLSDHQQVILKTLKNKYPTSDEVARIKHEYDLLMRLDYLGVIRILGLETAGLTPMIVMEDFGGESLASLFKRHQYILIELLNLAIRITEILGNIHEQNIIHKDINPSNIIWNPKTDQIKIIDFGISIKLSRENLAIKNPNQLEGTLHYISPEQTGRMNRALDYRTDYYSLGVSFYQMFSGKLPFESNDPLELVHCHIAKMPVPPYKLDHKIPPVLSNIVMKLMAKTPEERYQGSYGLIKDLERCLEAIKKGKIDYFEIGKEDISTKFRIPEKLYGREKEIENLIDVFDGAANGKRDMIFVFGSPGIGKSALINEIHKPIVEKRGYFCNGKYEQYKKGIPYSALIQAFRELLKQFLSESEDKLAILKEEILEAVGSSGQAIIDVIAEVELITGKQPEVQELPPTEAQNRFNMVFQNFVRSFAKKEHPLVLFLDDLQWADSSSLELIRVLLEDMELNYFLFIGAYRDNEVDEGHSLSLMKERMKKAGLSWKNIHVGPLMENHIGQLTADTLYSDQEKTADLANLLLLKTGGNPFFLKEYLIALYERGFIGFEHSVKRGKAGWNWDIPQIQQAEITENIIELLAEKVKKLPANTWDVLKIACCMGERCSLTMLAAIYEKSKEDTFEDLRQAIEEGIIIFIENSLKFVHDRVMEASYSLINERERKELHYTIGKEMLCEMDESQREDSIFDIADQWNHAKDLLSEKERKQLVEINFKAGQKAKSSTAYAAAVNFFREGLDMIPEDSWESDYQLTLSWHIELAEAEYLARNVKEAEHLFEIVLQNAKELMDKIRVYSLQIDYYITQSQFEKALEVSVKTLVPLGIPVTEKPSNLTIIRELIKAKILSRKRKIQDWLHQPEMTDEKKIAGMDIMEKTMPVAIIAIPIFVPIFSLKMVNLTFKYGNSPQSAYGYSMYGVILVGILGNINNGYTFLELAIKLADKSNSDIIKSKVYGTYGNLIHWKKHFSEVLIYLRKSQEFALNAGDFLYLGYAIHAIGTYLLYSGENLDTINTDFYQKYEKTIIKLNQPHTTSYQNLYYQTVLNLLGESDDFLLLKGKFFNEEEIIPRFQETTDETGMLLYYLLKQYLTYLSGEYSKGLVFSQKCEKLVNKKIAPGAVENLLFYFFYALISSALFPCAGRKEKKKYLKKLRSIRKKYRKYEEHNPHNYRNKYLLISAEINRITGKNMQETAKLYNESIQSAHKNGIIHEEAIACECAALYYLSLGLEEIASLYMNDAYNCYMRWGCIPKQKDLEKKFTLWIAKEKKGSIIDDFSISISATGTSDFFDTETIIKASNIISQEIALSELLKKMMHIVIENAGAQKGYFLLLKRGEWFIEAEGEMEQEEVKILQSVPIESKTTDSSLPLISKAIVKYVERTRKTVVLNDAAHKGSFTEDEYIKNQQPKSVLCLPLLNRGILEGLLYLENNLTTGAFTEEGVHVLNMLSSQIAISIKNASMYKSLDELNKNLEQKVRERTQQLNEKNEQVLDSIRYSQKIQTAILPLEERLKTAFSDHFIIFLPKDIVSGDFYWFTEMDDSIILIVADCTGHGVPGALLAMMGDIFLKEIINTNRVLEPARILQKLHKKVRIHLKQDEKGAETMDGMDVCLCRLEREKNKIEFAGAKRPLYIVRKNKVEPGEDMRKLIGIKGDKKSIGGRQKEINRNYTNHEIEVQKGDMIYLTTDGYADQPDSDLKKYGSKRLKAFFNKIAELPAEQQKYRIFKELNSYKDTEKQRDDITIVGIRF